MPPRPGETLEEYRWRLTFIAALDKLARWGELAGDRGGLFEEDVPLVTTETIRMYERMFGEAPPPRLYRMTDIAIAEGVALPAEHLLARIKPNPPESPAPVWIRKFVKQHQATLARKTGATSEVLGCGHYGCVLKSEDPRWVIKITRDPTEGPMVQRIMALRAADGGTGRGPSLAYDGIVFYRDIYEAGGLKFRGKDWPVYVIVREAVEPFDRALLTSAFSRFGNRDSGYHIPGLPDLPAYIVKRSLRGLANTKEHAGDYFRLKTPHRRESALEAYSDALSNIYDAFPEMAQTFYDLLDQDTVLRDVHAYNLGFTVVDWEKTYRPPRTVVIHDLGHTPTAAKEAFPSLWNPRGG